VLKSSAGQVSGNERGKKEFNVATVVYAQANRCPLDRRHRARLLALARRIHRSANGAPRGDRRVSPGTHLV